MKKKSRKLLLSAFILAAVLFVLFFAVRTAVQSDKAYRVIFIPKIIDDSNDFWTEVISGANMGAKEYGIDLTVEAGPDEEDWKTQNELISSAIESHPDALLVAPCSYTESTDLLEKAKNAGIKVTLIDSVVDREVQNLTVATDNVAAGRTLGTYAASILNADARIALIVHVKGASTAIDREKGVREGLGTLSDNICEVVYSGSSERRAYDLAVGLMKKYPDLAMIIGLNEPSAVGAGQAIREKGQAGKVLAVGFDSSLDEVRMMEEGIFSGIVIQKPYNMGYLGVKQTWQLLRGQSYTKSLESGSKLVTPDTIYTQENQQLLFPFTGNRS